jgi:D-amino peptidase
MHVLISVDIEGVAGVFHPDQTRPGNPEYERARLLMAEEANAAIAGAFDAGATAVTVNDSHGPFRNMPPERLDPRARVVQGKPRLLGMMAGVDTGIDAVVLIGYHSRAKGRGVLAHTINGAAFAGIRLNGIELGEAGLYASLAGDYGVPVVAASGDDVFVAENRPLFPDARFIETKQALGAHAGISLSPEAARAAIRAGVAAALAGPRPAPFRLAGPVTVLLRTQTPALADLFCVLPGTTRLAGDDLTFVTATATAAVRTLNAMSAMAASLR